MPSDRMDADRLEFELEHPDETAPSLARRALSRFSRSDSAAVVVSELVAHAVVHGASTLRFALCRSPEGFEVEVSSRSLLPPVEENMVIRLLDSWSLDWGMRNGIMLWAVLPADDDLYV